MLERLLDGVLIVGIYVLPILAMLCIGGIFSDYILPRCPRLIRFLERLLDVNLSDDSDETYYD